MSKTNQELRARLFDAPILLFVSTGPMFSPIAKSSIPTLKFESTDVFESSDLPTTTVHRIGKERLMVRQ